MHTHTACLRIAFFLGVAAGCALLAGNVCAQDKIVTESYRVDTQGLDLTRPADVQTVYTRLQNAAWVVCTRGTHVALLPVDNPKACIEQALGDAIRSAKVPMLTRIYLASHTLQEAAAHGIELSSQLAAK